MKKRIRPSQMKIGEKYFTRSTTDLPMIEGTAWALTKTTNHWFGKTGKIESAGEYTDEETFLVVDKKVKICHKDGVIELVVLLRLDDGREGWGWFCGLEDVRPAS